MALSTTNILFLMSLGFTLAAPIGPVNMEMLKQALKSRNGWVFGLITGVGAMTGDFVIATTILFVGSEFLSSLISINLVYGILVLANILILSYIGVSALKSTVEIDADIVKGKDNDQNVNLKILRQLMTGFAIVVTSPWSYFWWITFGPYILNSGLPLGTLNQIFIVTLFFLGGIFTWVFIFCSILGISSRFASPRILKSITNFSAIIILIFAVKILNDSLCYLFGIGIC